MFFGAIGGMARRVLPRAFMEQNGVRRVATWKACLWTGCVAGALASTGCQGGQLDVGAEEEATATRADRVAIGRQIFFDESLSTPPGQSCATCHDPRAGFADPRRDLPVSRGAVEGRFGSRNTPAAAYSSFAGELRYEAEDETYEGGVFWDGRADSLAEQALLPLLNPLEMNNRDEAEIAEKIRAAPYAMELARIYGEAVLLEDEAAVEAMADAISSFEASPEVNRFSSKYDAWRRGEVALSPAEERGRKLFDDPKKGNCAACHPSTPREDDPSRPPLFTDFTYDNIGIPKNEDSPFLSLDPTLNPDGADFVDHGLAGTLKDAAQDGLFRVPSLRNVALTAPYGHNGYFATLRDVVRFYNERDVDPTWAPPEIAATVNHEELGDLRLTDEEIDDIVSFLNTLSDGYDDGAVVTAE